MKKTKTIKSKYTENWVPVKAINNGVIITDNNTRISGVKIMPKNIFILDSSVQDTMLINLRNFYNTLDFEFWIICADRPVDINVYLANLQLLYNTSQNNAKIRKLIVQDINKANQFKASNIVDTEFYLLFREKNPDMMQKKLRTIINGLANAGLTARQTSNEDLRVILDNFLNGGMETQFGTVLL